MDQRDINEAREERQDKRLAEIKLEYEKRRARTQKMQDLNTEADATILKVLRGIDDLVRYVPGQACEYIVVKAYLIWSKKSARTYARHNKSAPCLYSCPANMRLVYLRL